MKHPFCLDDDNLMLVSSSSQVDRINAEFYGKYPYPWRPMRLDRICDGNFSRRFICQEIGDWRCKSIPEHANIWVAGCGTNQAAITALHFPSATVVGSDLSRPSLDLCARTASELGLDNLSLREESVNESGYHEAFDYILCTGVIHHNADPSRPLRRIAAALKPSGVLELMVYNRFHRIFTTAFQKAIRILAKQVSTAVPDNSVEMAMATALVKDFPVKCNMQAFLDRYKDVQQEQFADSLIQPVEYSYTVESLGQLARSCGLELLTPAVNMFDRAVGSFRWNLTFPSAEIEDCYETLDDLRRWQVTNLLLCDRSPMLWFYLRRIDSGILRASERKICETFLDCRFVRAEVTRQGYIIGKDGSYRQSGSPEKYPVVSGGSVLAKIIAAADGRTCMRDLLQRFGTGGGFAELTDMRVQLTTPSFPYLFAVGGESGNVAD